MNFFYNTGIAAYKLAVQLVSSRNRKAKLMLEGQARTFDYLRETIVPGQSYIWIHVSSLGEFEQGRPLIEKIKKERPQDRILITFFSPSGYEVRKNYDKADAVCYLPFDLPGNVKEFLDLVQPKMAIFVKYEFWGNYLSELERRSIPTYIISSVFRDRQIFFKPWGGLFRRMLKCYTRIFVQNEESRKLLKSIDVENVEVAGDTRFDRVANVRRAAKDLPIIASMTQDQPLTLVMGSSWPADEDVVIPYFNAHPEIKLIVVPHEFDAERLKEIKAKITRPVALYSQTSEADAQHLDALIVDCFGILSSIYRYGQLAYIGGGFGAGIHNVNEAAVYGIPVVFGPKYGKFCEAKGLIAAGGGFSVGNAQEFARVLDGFLGDRDTLLHAGSIADHYIKTHLGATSHVYDSIF